MNKKEAIFNYKNTLRPMGVYQIRNTANGRVLVGSNLNLDGRRNRFEFERRDGSFANNREIKKDWDEAGPDAFVFEILEELKPNDDPQYDYRADLAALEKQWLEKLQPYGDRGYNHKKC
ncbi:MAG: GIY-YIG nuclease family protein [Candidatus Sumerlaeia bacterium]